MKEWIIPCNLAVYDVYDAFKKLKFIDWIQHKSMAEGDTVYIYVGKPISKVEFKCKVIKANMPVCEIDDSQYMKDEEFFKAHEFKKFMRLKLVRKLSKNKGNIEMLRMLGLKQTQWQNPVPNQEISDYLK